MALAPLPLPSVALWVEHRGPLGTVGQRAWVEVDHLVALADDLAPSALERIGAG